MLDELIHKYLNEDGKLDCKDAYKISAKTKIPIREIGEKANAIGIRISGCELGQFGLFKGIGEFSEIALDKLTPFVDEKNRVACKEARAMAGGVGLKKIRGALKEKNIDVKYCELGCFNKKNRKRLYIKTKSWIENETGDLLFGKGKTEVLELIKKEGSIAKASEKLGMNYKKTWTHVNILQKNLDDVLVESHKGGGEDSGSKLTDIAQEYIDNYKQLEKEIEEFANERFIELFLKPRNIRKLKD